MVLVCVSLLEESDIKSTVAGRISEGRLQSSEFNSISDSDFGSNLDFQNEGD